MLLRNYWYVAALSDEVGTAPLGRTILGEPIAFYRCESGAIAAIENRCCHRAAPLSRGMVRGNNLECGYHGMTFNSQGICVRIPGQSSIPPSAKVKSYPVVERWRYIWVWIGDRAKADPSTIPDELFRYNQCPGWKAVGEHVYLKADWRLIVENLLDLGHATYLHAKTIGTDLIAQTPVEIADASASGVTVKRWMPDHAAPPFYDKVGGFSERQEKVDRWQFTRFELPSHCYLNVGVASVGSVDRTGEFLSATSHRVRMRILNAITPETETTTHYFWATPRDFALESPEMDALLKTSFHNTVMEDVAMIEDQQKTIAGTNGKLMDISADKGLIAARRIWERASLAPSEGVMVPA